MTRDDGGLSYWRYAFVRLMRIREETLGTCITTWRTWLWNRRKRAVEGCHYHPCTKGWLRQCRGRKRWPRNHGCLDGYRKDR